MYILTFVTSKRRSNRGWICQLVQMHLRCKFVDRRSVTCRDSAHIIFFYDDLSLCVQSRLLSWSSYLPYSRSSDALQRYWLNDRQRSVGTCPGPMDDLHRPSMAALYRPSMYAGRHVHTAWAWQSEWPLFVVRPGFISKSVSARLQVSVCSGYDLCHPG